MNRQKQRGVTALGWLLILSLIGIFSLATLRLAPIYLEYYRISSVLGGLKADKSAGVESKKEITTYLNKRFDIESIARIKPTDLKITPKDEFYQVRAKYDARTPFVGNLNFIVTFDKSVEIPR